MAVNVRIPAPLRSLTGGKEEVSVRAGSVAELVADLERSYPGFQSKILDEQGRVRRFVNLFVNEEDIRFLQNLDTKLKDGDRVTIVPAIAGGR
jgi:molybdopterin synthase sulfur carrier subunit